MTVVSESQAVLRLQQPMAVEEKAGEQEDRGTGGQEDRRTGGQEERRTGA